MWVVHMRLASGTGLKSGVRIPMHSPAPGSTQTFSQLARHLGPDSMQHDEPVPVTQADCSLTFSAV